MNPGVVSFERSPEYIYDRANRHLRENNDFEALELFRRAADLAPDSIRYRLDLARLAHGMYLFEYSNRIVLDIMAMTDSVPDECYCLLALNSAYLHEADRASRALAIYKKKASVEAFETVEYLVSGLLCDVGDVTKSGFTRKVERALRLLHDGDGETALDILKRCTQKAPEDTMLRALYAHALIECGEEEEALRIVTAIRDDTETEEPRILEVCARVLFQAGLPDEAYEVARRAIDCAPVGDALIALLLMNLGMHREAAEQLRMALQQHPYSRELRHYYALALYYSTGTIENAVRQWQRNLKMDPLDSVAEYYIAALSAGDTEFLNDQQYYFSIPDHEAERRMGLLRSMRSEEAVEYLRDHREFRSILNWAARNADRETAGIAISVLIDAADHESISMVREYLYSESMPVHLKLEARVRVRNLPNEQAYLPSSDIVQDILLPPVETMIRDLPAFERGMIRLVNDVLFMDYDLLPGAETVVLWMDYKDRCEVNRLVSTQEAAAALAWNYLIRNHVTPSVEKLARQFECKKRLMVYYARVMAGVLEGV